MGVETAAIIGAGALGQGLGLWQQGRDRRHQVNWAQQNRQNAFNMMQTDPSGLEQMLANFGTTASMNQASNSGQDALMQMLRADPSRQNDYVSNTFQSVAGQEDPFAAGGAYSALDAVDRRNQAQQVAALRGSAGSIGQRFGSNAANAEATLRATLNENTAARNAQLAQQFLSTRLGAAQAGGQYQLGLGQQRMGAASQLAGIGQNQLATMLAALQGAGQLQAQRNQYNLGLFGVGAGQQLPASLGGQIGDSTSGLAALYYLMRPSPGATSAAGSGAGGGFYDPWSPFYGR